MIETLTKARDLIEERGLAHGKYFCGVTGSLCSLGAVMEALGLDPLKGGFDDPQLKPIIAELSETIGSTHPAGPRGQVFNFNDANDQSGVVALFNDTIERLSA